MITPLKIASNSVHTSIVDRHIQIAASPRQQLLSGVHLTSTARSVWLFPDSSSASTSTIFGYPWPEMAFTFAALCYLIALIAIAFCIFFAIFTVISIDELRTEYRNPIEQCRNLNQLILPEYGLHVVFTVLFVFSVQMGAVIWNLPLLAYHIHRYMNRPVMSGPGIYDPTSIMNQDQLSKAYREGWIKLGFYLISFFYYLYALIYTLVTSS
ncbi:hypothetical protein L596_027560 [Steinernema carpocapsae]|uniref:Protein cornichon n=1 Tax=Steinernema carpocapsae TaxID=34508 RepID=A0A4U5LVW3_STECR|nr:hypothetical protein L596_027560 [Steinernema carpocapsae]